MSQTQNVSSFQAAMRGWRDALTSSAKMPQLFLAAVAVYLAINILSALAEYRITQEDGSSWLVALLRPIVVGLLGELAVVPVVIGVYRYILLGELSNSHGFKLNSTRFQRMYYYSICIDACLWFLALAVVFVLALLFQTPANAPPMSTSIVWLICVSDVVIVTIAIFMFNWGVKGLLLLPSIAIDSSNAKWRNAIFDAKGRFWNIVWAMIWTARPIIIVVNLYLFAISNTIGISSVVLVSLIQSFVQVFVAAATAATIANLFDAYADRLGAHRDIQFVAAT